MDSTIPSAIPRDELAIPFPGGTLTIDGVTFTYVELEAGPWPTSGVRYLMFVRRCGNASAHLAYTFDSLYPVTTDGTILPSEGSPRSGLSRELVQIGTVQRLRDHLTRVQ
jgi:hypothetical protein